MCILNPGSSPRGKPIATPTENPVFRYNLSVLRRRRPELEPLCSEPAASWLHVEPSHGGRPTLVAELESRRISLHSRVDPLKEAEDLVNRLSLKAGRIPVILGLGLGYHVLDLLERLPEDAPLAVVEPSPLIFRTAMEQVDLSPLLERPGCLLLIGEKPAEVIKRLTRFQMDNGFADLQAAVHPPSLRLFPEVLGRLEQLMAGWETGLALRLIYPRLHRESLRILIFDTGYYLVREISRAAETLGHQTRRLSITDQAYGSDDTIRSLLAETARFRPDFVLTVNHLGFDQNGVMADLLERMNLPFASWFVDSPLLILNAARRQGGATGSVFLWDRAYQREVKALGYENVHYLPLGTDHTLFKPLNGRSNPLKRSGCDVGFVGDSMTNPVEKYLARAGLRPRDQALIAEAADAFTVVSDRTPARIMAEMDLEQRLANGSGAPERRVNLEALITWWATRRYRLGLVNALEPLHPTIVGDPGWEKLLDGRRFHLVPPLDYYDELPWFYPLCRINFNATSQQMKTGVNQRIFDVPACGAFLLTDYREQIEDLFEVGRDVICYHGPEEALDLARYYLDHENARKQVALRALTRVWKEHTYECRMAMLIEQMRGDHQS